MDHTTHPTTRALVDALTAEVRADAATWFAEPTRLVEVRPPEGGPARIRLNPAWVTMRERRRRIEVLRRQLWDATQPAAR